MSGLELVWALAQDLLWSALAALGFALVFNVPRRALPGCLLCGAAGHATRMLLGQFGVGIEIGTLAGALVVGSLGAVCARYWKVPVPIFTINGAIPLVPGVFAYQAMLGLISVSSATVETGNVLLVDASINAIRTAIILGAIALGIAAPSLIFQRRKPVV